MSNKNSKIKCPHCKTNSLRVQYNDADTFTGPYTTCISCGLLYDSTRAIYYLPLPEIDKLTSASSITAKRSAYEAFMLTLDNLKTELAEYGSEPMYTFSQILLDNLKLQIKQKELEETE